MAPPPPPPAPIQGKQPSAYGAMMKRTGGAGHAPVSSAASGTAEAVKKGRPTKDDIRRQKMDMASAAIVALLSNKPTKNKVREYMTGRIAQLNEEKREQHPVGGSLEAVSIGWAPWRVMIGRVIPIGSLVAGAFLPVRVVEGIGTAGRWGVYTLRRWGYFRWWRAIIPARNFTTAEGKGSDIADILDMFYSRLGNYFARYRYKWRPNSLEHLRTSDV